MVIYCKTTTKLVNTGKTTWSQIKNSPCLLVSDLFMNVRIFSQFTRCLSNLQRRMLIWGSKGELSYILGLIYTKPHLFYNIC